MANTYSWEIRALNCYPKKDGHDNVVYTVHYSRLADDGAGHTATVYGALEIPLSSSFIPYESLTQANVISWIENSLSADDIVNLNAHLDRLIAEQVNPVSITPPLPW